MNLNLPLRLARQLARASNRTRISADEAKAINDLAARIKKTRMGKPPPRPPAKPVTSSLRGA